MRSLSRFVCTSLLVAPLVACGGSVDQDASSGGTGGSGATGGSGGGTGGSGGTGATAATGGTGAIGGGGSGGGPGGGGAGGTSCDAYLDETAPAPVTVRLTNQTGGPIYIGGDNGCGPFLPYELQGPTGPVPLVLGGCGNTCEALQQHGDWCPDACMVPPVIVISPGGSYDASWSGTTFVPETMPQSCYFEPQFAPPTCSRRVVAPVGEYGALATAATAIVCTDLGTCTCTPNAQGYCEIPWGASLSGATLSAKASFDFPSISLVVLTFQ